MDPSTAAPPPPPEVLKFLIAEATQFYVILYTGILIGTVFYGVTLLQTIYYYRTFSNDAWVLQILAAFLFCLDTLTTVLPAISIKWYLIDNFGNYFKVAYLPIAFRVENGILTVITFIVQCYFANQIWILSHGNKGLVGAVLFLASSSFVLGWILTAHLFVDPSTSSLQTPRLEYLGGFIQGTAALCDIIITSSMCWLLWTSRDGIRSTRKAIDTLIIIIINRGLLTSIAQTSFLITYVVFPYKVYWQPFHLVLGKLYVNSFLAMLNIRGTVNEGLVRNHDETSLKFAPTSSLGRVAAGIGGVGGHHGGHGVGVSGLGGIGGIGGIGVGGMGDREQAVMELDMYASGRRRDSLSLVGSPGRKSGEATGTTSLDLGEGRKRSIVDLEDQKIDIR